MLGLPESLLPSDALAPRANHLQHVRQVHSRKERRTQARRSPTESQALADDILLLPTISSANERDRQRDGVEEYWIEEVGESEGERAGDEAGDLEGPVVGIGEGDARD